MTEPDFGPDVTEVIDRVQITYPAWCRVTVKRKLSDGEVVEFTAKEFWRENYAVKGGPEKSYAPNAMWTKRPYGQIAKCAEAQALRKAFPEIGSEPTADEMAGKSINEFDTVADAATGEVTPRPAARAELPEWPADSFATQFPRWKKAIQTGLKTTAEILAMARSKGALSAAQELSIKDVTADAPTEGVTDVTPKNEATASTAGDGWDEFTEET